MSVARILIGVLLRVSPSDSITEIAIEYTSSPVEQPGTQTRIGAWSGRVSNSGNIASFKAVNAPGSRKKLVTRMRKSWVRSCTSAGSFCNR